MVQLVLWLQQDADATGMRGFGALCLFSAEPQAIAEVFSCCDRQCEGSFPTVIVVRLLIGAPVFRNNQQVTSRKDDQRY